jgi:hypothetical protein
MQESNMNNSKEIVIESPSFNFLFCHKSVYIQCGFCDEKIPTTKIRSFFYEDNMSSSWIACCLSCSKNCL